MKKRITLITLMLCLRIIGGVIVYADTIRTIEEDIVIQEGTASDEIRNYEDYDFRKLTLKENILHKNEKASSKIEETISEEIAEDILEDAVDEVV